MPPTNAHDPLRTTDQDPSAAPPRLGDTADFASGSPPADGNTGPYVPGKDAAPMGAVPERGPAAVSVPGYEIEGVLGRGGMGVVYKALHLSLKRTVALKMVLAGGHAGPRDLARFRIEAEAVARLQHPNIVQIHEVGAADGHPYCALEFVEGGNLASKSGGKPIPAHEAAKLVESLARAMQLAHSRNVVHRDLKPANILLATDGTPKITDFGLARQMDSDSGETLAGAVMGTPSYMAPEQASGRAHEAGPAADVYALGAILYDCLTGRPPFKGKTVVETLDQVRTQEPAPPSRWQKGVPLDLESICLKCLRKEPEKRYTSAAELADELVRYQQGEPILARPVGRLERAVKWVRRNPVVAGAAVAVVLALAVGTTVSYLKYREAEAARGKADAALKKEAERADELKYYLGISDMLLASAAYDNRGVNLAAERLDSVPGEQRGWEWRYLKRQTRGGLFTLYGHTEAVSSVSFSPDGTRIVTGSHDQTAKVWDARTGTALLDLKGHTGGVTSVSFSPDGTRIVTGSQDKMAKVWDARTGTALLDLKGHTSEVWSVSFSPDDARIVTGGGEHDEPGEAKMWDARTGTALLDLKGHTGRVRSVAVSPDGTRIVTGSQDQTAKVWDARTGTALLDLKGHTGGVTSVSFSPDGKRIVTGSLDRTAKVWDAAAGQELLAFKGHTHWMTSVAFSPDGQRIVTGAGEWGKPGKMPGEAKVWDARTGTTLLDLKGHTSGVARASFSPDGTRIVTGSGDKTAKVWDARTGTAQLDLKGHTGVVTSVSFSPDGTRIVSGSGDKTARVWNARTGTALLDLKGHTSEVWSVSFSPDGTRIVTGSWDKTAKVWDARTGTALVDLKGHTSGLSGVSFSPDGTRIVTGSDDHTAKVWDARTGTALVDLKGHTGMVKSVSFSPDGTRIVTGSHDQSAKVWDARTGTALVDLKGHTGWVWSASFSPNGARIVTGSHDQSAKVWDARTGTALLDLKGHTSVVWSVAFSPDGTRIVTGSLDQSAKVWDARTGTALLDLNGHTNGVSSVSFSPDSTRIVTGSYDNTANVRDAPTGLDVLDLKGHTGEVTSVSFSPDSSLIVTGSLDGTAKVWDARTGTLLHDLKGHTGVVNRVSFCPDGTRIVTVGALGNMGESKVWDAQTGQELKGAPIPQTLPPCRISSDGRFFAHASGNRVELIPLKPDAEELEYRLIHTRPNYWRYQEDYDAARTANDRFAARFYLNRLLSLPMQRTTERFQERNAGQADPLLIARTGFHHPALAKTPYDRGIVALLAVNGDRLAQRLVAQQLLREGKPGPAIPLLVWCMASRPATSPPVEELLLAQAYLDLKQPAEAKRFHRAATEWLDRPRDPKDGLGVGFAPNGDPRRNPFDWEVWHETDVFRAWVEQRLAAGCRDNTIRLFDVASRQEVAELRGHTDSAHAVAWSPDGTRLVSGSGDFTVRVWDALSAQSRGETNKAAGGR